MTEIGYGKSLYGSALYGSSPCAFTTKLYCGLNARVVRPRLVSPPIIDTIIEGFVQRFNYLQQGLQIMTDMNKIEYARGKAEVEPGDKLNLDDVWGKLYDYPRLTGMSDDEYRRLLQTRVMVLTGSGTTDNACAVIDHMVGEPGATEIESRYPSRAIISFRTISAMRTAKAKAALLETVLHDLFAAGVSYEMSLTILDVWLYAAIEGEVSTQIALRSAVVGDSELSIGIDALIALGKIIDDIGLYAAIEGWQNKSIRLNAAVSTDISVSIGCLSAIEGDTSTTAGMLAALVGEQSRPVGLLNATQCERSVDVSLYAAISKNFMLRSGLLAFCVKMGRVQIELNAAVQATLSIQCGLKARIARRI